MVPGDTPWVGADALTVTLKFRSDSCLPHKLKITLPPPHCFRMITLITIPAVGVVVAVNVSVPSPWAVHRTFELM